MNYRMPYIGDRVLLTDHMTAGIVPEMEPYLGTVQTVVNSNSVTGLFQIKADPKWLWSVKLDIQCFVDTDGNETKPASAEAISDFLGF